MAKILLVDLPAADRDLLAAKKYDVEARSTSGASAAEGALEPPAGCEIVFWQAGGPGAEDRPAVPAGVREAFAARLREGLRVVCFVAAAGADRIADLVGPVEGLRIEESVRGDAVVFNPRALFHVPFERFKPYIPKAFRLLGETLGDGVWEKAGEEGSPVEVLAKTLDGAPVAMSVARGKGGILFLPSFGAKTVEVVEYILKDRLGLGADAAAEPATDWLDAEDYVFPELKTLVARREEERKRFEMVMADYDRQLRDLKAGGQEEFHRLLKGEGAALRKAVIHAFRYLGWGRVVDVDEYWKNTIRNKEEDAWLLDAGDAPVEAAIRKGEIVLVLVRGGKNWAADDECALLQKFKGRRMQEFDNTRMKAVLVGNYFSAVPAKERQNPFSAAQIEEAQKDGNGLMTTWELFRAVKAEKENRISKDALREQVRLKTGLVVFDI